MLGNKENPAKIAFYYLLSLVALVNMAIAVGIVLFQLINKNIKDILDISGGTYDSGALKYSISAIIIAAPVYYIFMWLIHKSLLSGALDKDSAIRRWLTYFIMLVSSIVMLIWMISTINTFLNGDLSLKFILKALSIMLIAGSIFGYYFYDIRRDDVTKKKNMVVLSFFYGSLVIVIASLIVSFFYVESPTQTRNRRYDEMILSRFSMIDSSIQTYYNINKKMPKDFAEIKSIDRYLSDEQMSDPATGKPLEYKVMSKDEYQLCATFKTSNKNPDDQKNYPNPGWLHDAGYQCIKQKVIPQKVDGVPAVPVEKVMP